MKDQLREGDVITHLDMESIEKMEIELFEKCLKELKWEGDTFITAQRDVAHI